MTGRRIAGWALLSLIPATFLTFAILSRQLVEFLIVIAGCGVLGAVMWKGLDLIDSPESDGDHTTETDQPPAATPEDTR